MLGHLIAARRSTVTLASRALAREVCVRRLDDRSWLLTTAAQRKLDAVARTSDSERAIAENLLVAIEAVATRHGDTQRQPRSTGTEHRADETAPRAHIRRARPSDPDPTAYSQN
jgi:hypothetical protein